MAMRLNHRPLSDAAARHVTTTFHETGSDTGFLTGRAGAALALATHRQPTSQQVQWDSQLMLT
ncbi:hypothetical protein ACPC54_19230 [Kitasatospora sp. NPDC094028]